MTQGEGFILIYAAVLIGGAIRILLKGTRLDKWIRKTYGDPPWKKGGRR